MHRVNELDLVSLTSGQVLSPMSMTCCLFVCGKLQTHPSQTCFMSSVDLHTHYSYQVISNALSYFILDMTEKAKCVSFFIFLRS